MVLPPIRTILVVLRKNSTIEFIKIYERWLGFTWTKNFSLWIVDRPCFGTTPTPQSVFLEMRNHWYCEKTAQLGNMLLGLDAKLQRVCNEFCCHSWKTFPRISKGSQTNPVLSWSVEVLVCCGFWHEMTWLPSILQDVIDDVVRKQRSCVVVNLE